MATRFQRRRRRLAGLLAKAARAFAAVRQALANESPTLVDRRTATLHRAAAELAELITTLHEEQQAQLDRRPYSQDRRSS